MLSCNISTLFYRIVCYLIMISYFFLHSGLVSVMQSKFYLIETKLVIPGFRFMIKVSFVFTGF